MHTVRHQTSAIYSFYEIRVFLILTMTYVLYKRFSIFSYHTTLIRQ